MLDAGGGVVAFLMPDHDHAPAGDPAEPADDRLIVGKGAITRERHEIVDEARNIILEAGPLGMARDLRLLPLRQFGIGLTQQPIGFGLEPGDFGFDVQRAVMAIGRLAQLDDPRFQFRDRLFELEQRGHRAAVRSRGGQRQRA